jgi:hypothetical protein
VKYLKLTGLALLAVAIGIGIGIYRIAGVETSEAFFHNGCWTGSRDLPLGKDKLLTAQVTVFALFALPSSEAIYLFARRDEKKELLNSENDYEIKGNLNQIKAKYWSVTLYGKDLYLVPNSDERFSFNNSSLKTDSAGNFTITVSQQRKGDNWLPAPDKAKFALVLRVYKGEWNYLQGLETTALPTIKKLNQ